MIIEGPKELDNSSTRVKTIRNHRMFGKQRTRKKKLVDQKYQIVIRVRKVVTMPISVQRKTMAKFQQ